MKPALPPSLYDLKQSLTRFSQFGYGLSYSNFSYSPVSLSSTTASATDTITVSVDVTNNSTVDGTEVVQVYVKDDVSSVVVPNKQLKGFAKVPIAAGATETVKVDVNVADLGLWNIKLNYVVEPGNFTILVGSSSGNLPVNATLTVA